MKYINYLIFTTLLLTTSISAQYFSKNSLAVPSNDGGDSRSVNWIDINKDGHLDLFVTNGPSGGENNFFYLNNGDGSFTKVDTLEINKDNKPSDGSTWGDYDNDGHPDLFIANWYGKNNLLYWRNFNNNYSDRDESNPGTLPSYSETGSWGDFNNDGYLDLYVTNSAGSNKRNFLHKNNQDGTFTLIDGGDLISENSSSRNINWIDYNNDDLFDLFIANENNENNQLFQNNGDETFTEVTTTIITSTSRSSLGSSFGDIDNDGDFDLVVCNFSNQKNELFINNGDGTFSVSSDTVVSNDNGFSIGSSFGDIDNDGDLDLYISNGFSGSSQSNNFLYLNDGTGKFTKISGDESTSDLGRTYGNALGDYDNDGDLDLFIAKCFNASENNALFINQTSGNNWIKLNLTGTVSNSSSIGAIVKIKSNINGSDIWQTRMVEGQSGYCGQNLQVHFGLLDATTIDTLIIKWPSGQLQIATDLNINEAHNIKETISEGYLKANFIENERRGYGPTEIKFLDKSVSFADSNSLTFKWDFNNDGTIDSEVRNPNFIFTDIGMYSVSLTVSDGITEDTKLKANLIEIKRIPGTPNLISYSPEFTDTTINKGDRISFEVNAEDTTGYELSYNWTKNSAQVNLTNSYNYRASAFGAVPRDDTIMVVINNGFNSISKTWLITVDDLTNITDGEIITEYKLNQNYPNPFNPSTNISFQIPTGSFTSLKIYNSNGELVKIIFNEFLHKGKYDVNFSGDNLSSGIYFYQLISKEFSMTNKMILLK